MARNLARDEPWTEAILRLLESEAYRMLARHQPGLIAEIPGISEKTEQRCLDKLQAAGIVEKQADLYRCVGSLTVNTQALSSLKAHWSAVATKRLANPLKQDVACYNVLIASTKDLEQISELIVATYR